MKDIETAIVEKLPLLIQKAKEQKLYIEKYSHDYGIYTEEGFFILVDNMTRVSIKKRSEYRFYRRNKINFKLKLEEKHKGYSCFSDVLVLENRDYLEYYYKDMELAYKTCQSTMKRKTIDKIIKKIEAV